MSELQSHEPFLEGFGGLCVLIGFTVEWFVQYPVWFYVMHIVPSRQCTLHAIGIVAHRRNQIEGVGGSSSLSRHCGPVHHFSTFGESIVVCIVVSIAVGIVVAVVVAVTVAVAFVVLIVLVCVIIIIILILILISINTIIRTRTRTRTRTRSNSNSGFRY